MSERQVIKSSRLLYDFYVWWLVNKDEIEMCHKYGLCANLYYYLCLETYGRLYDTMREELRNQFSVAGHDTDIPFGISQYAYGSANDTQHLDPSRIQWVKDRIEDGMIEEEAKES